MFSTQRIESMIEEIAATDVHNLPNMRATEMLVKRMTAELALSEVAIARIVGSMTVEVTANVFDDENYHLVVKMIDAYVHVMEQILARVSGIFNTQEAIEEYMVAAAGDMSLSLAI